MYSQGNFNANFANLNQRWEQFIRSDQLDIAEFSNLCNEETLPLILNFNAIDNPEIAKLLKMLGSVQFPNPDMKDTVDDLMFVEKWNAHMPQTLLSGRLISRGSKALQPSEKKFFFEDDNVIQARIESLMNLFRTNNSENVSQMILNALETYKKVIICETAMQNKVTCKTLDNLIKSLLIITCHRKDYDHLRSLIKFSPLHRKIQFIISETNAIQTAPHIKRCRLFVCAAIAQDLLHSEFMQPIERQNIQNLNLFVNVIVDLAVNETEIDKKLERIFLCANDMAVISDYYYLVANIVRLKMPNRHETFVIKLISIGLSHDLSRLEQIKYTKDGEATKYTEEEFVKVHRKMFVALLILGFIVKDYSLRRLCIQAADVCEPESVICKEILLLLPAQDLPVNVEDEAMKITLVHLREQLETFQSPIKANVNLSTTWKTSSVLCYENLDFLNRRKLLSDDLQPLEYPGIEKHLKRARKESEEQEEEEEKKKPLNVDKVFEELKTFHDDISARLKRMKNPFRSNDSCPIIPPTSPEIKAVIIKALQGSHDFEMLCDNEIFMRMSEPFENLKNYHLYFSNINKEQKQNNKANLFFDFSAATETNMTVTQMYQEGIVRVHDLCCQGYNIFDIENVMLYTIMEKKNLYMVQEFVGMNKNRSVKSARSQVQSAFFYLTARPLPQLALLCRSVNIGYYSTSMLDYCVDHYTFDATPCSYSYKKKGEDGDMNGSREGESLALKPVKPKAVRKSTGPKPSVASKLTEAASKPPPILKPPVMKVVKQTPPKTLTPPGAASRNHKAKRPPAVDLPCGVETFNSSQELLNVFAVMANELSSMIGAKVSMDLRQICDSESKHDVAFTYNTASELPVNLCTLRNDKVSLITTKVIKLPARIHGSLTVTFDTTDSIFYDAKNEPHIKTHKVPKVSGFITLDHMSHTIKMMDIECTVCNCKSKFKFSMRGGSRSWEKKTKDDRKQRETDHSSSSSCDGMIKDIKEEVIDSFLENPPAIFSHLDPPRNGDMINIKVEPNQTSFQAPPSVIVRHQSPIRQTPVQVVNPMMSAPGYQGHFATTPSLPSPTMVKNVTAYAQQPQQQFQESGHEQLMQVLPQMQSQQPHFASHHFTQQIIQQPVSHQVSINQHSVPQQLPVNQQVQLQANQQPTQLHQQPTQLHQQPTQLHHQVNQLYKPPSQYPQQQQPPRTPPQYQNPSNLPPEPSVIVTAIPASPKSEKFKIISVEGLPPHKMSFSGPLKPEMHSNKFTNGTPVKEEVKEEPPKMAVDAIDFEAELPAPQFVLKPKIDEAPVHEQTPPTSPPPLHYRVKKEVVEPSLKKLVLNPLSVINKEITLSIIKKEIKKEMITSSADRILNNTPPNDTADVIDLTDEAIDLDHCESPPPPPKKHHHEDIDPLAINFVDIGEMPSSGIDMKRCNLDKEYLRVMKKVGMKRMGPKRIRPDFEEDRQRHKLRKTKIFLVDVMKEMTDSVFQTHMKVKAKPVRLKLPLNYESINFNRQDVRLMSAHEGEEPYINPDTVVSDITDSTFHFVYQNSVSYQPLLTNANNQCNDKINCNLNNANHVNNRVGNEKFLREVDLGKSFDTDARRVNFTKNLKNVRKFARWSPKVNNDAIVDDNLKGDEKKKELSHDIPGLNSFEFFRFPATPRRSLHVKVIHVMKNGSLGDNDMDQHSEGQAQVTNGESSTSTHVQKIGQTSINETKTIQTSFGSIIKNTYPPATLSSRTTSNDNGKDQRKDAQPLKKVMNHDANSSKVNSNIKIVACSSSQADLQKNSRNQTLINMLTQQVMLPTNSNRHFIITTNATKCENNVTTVSSSLPTHQNVVKKVVTGQSQLVQILNSPPNFTMKASPNVTVAPPNNATFKAELPMAAKQQGIVQFICKTDGKIIHLTPICSNSAGGGSNKITYKVDTSGAKGPTILHHANQQIIINNQLKKSDNQNILTIIQKQDDKNKTPSTPTSPISTRSIYEETYAKFIQTSTTSSGKPTDMGLLTISSSPLSTPITSSTSSSIIQKIGKTVIQSSGQALPKFNQAFGKTIFTTTQPEMKGKQEIVTRVSFAETKSITKATRTISEIKSTNAGTLLSLIEGESSEKQLPTLQSNLLYARPIGNGKLLASNNNNVLLTALRGNNTSGNVRIITSMPDTSNRSVGGTIMSPMRISVPIQIPKLINTSVRPQTPGNFRQQIVIATTPSRMPMNQGSKLESLLMTSQIKQEVQEEPKQKKVDHSTLEQLREFDMVLEQVLERSSSEVTTASMSSPPTPDSPKKQLLDAKMKINTNVTITSISPCESPKPGSSSSSSSSAVKAAPKLQEDEHTAQRILDILANYKEQVRNSPDLNNKPAPRRRANPPTNPPAAKRKKIVGSGSGSMKSSKQFGSTSDMMTDTMGSEEDSSCGMGSGVASTGSMNNSPQPQDIDDQTDVSMDNNFYMEDSKRETALSPQSSSSSVATSPSHNKFPISRRLILTEAKPVEQKNIVITNAQQPTGTLGTTIERFAAHGSTAAVLMPGNYLLPMNVLKSGQLAILSSNNGQKIIAVPTNQLHQSGTSIILQRYLNQANDNANKTTESAFKAVRPTISYINSKQTTPTQSNTLYIRPIPMENKTIISSQMKQEDEVKESKFVSDKTLITEIIQQQQQLSHTHQHPQQNFMIKLNEHQPSDPRSSSSIMFVPSTSQDPPKIKIEEIDYDDYMKEDAIDLLHESDAMQKSPMLNTKIEADDNTNSNHAGGGIYDDVTVKLENDPTQKFQQFPIILNKTNNVSGSRNIKGFLIDPTNKIVMYNDRKPATIEKEFFNQKSFSEECADLGVDEPIASDLFPEADLLFDSGSPKFDQISSHDNAMHIKKELENGQVLLEMNYNHNMETESWLNFDTEEELVDDSQLGDDDKGDGGGHSGDYF